MPVNVNVLQNYASSLAAHRLLLYSLCSFGAVIAVVANALKRQSNFYSVAVFLSRSNGSVVVLGNFGVLLALLCGRLLQQIFFGPLRIMEVERLYDRTWFFVTESLLAFTIFRDEFDVPFASMFGLLLFTKCFHWLLADRIEWMDQRPYPGPPLSFHLRVNALFTLLWTSDCLALLLLTENMLAYGLDGKILFASELAILLASLSNSFAKYCICLIDIRRASVRGGENAPPWEDKSMWTFYVELFTDFMKLVTYLTFFLLVLSVYGLPLNIVRDVYITGRSFVLRCRDLVNYRTATRNMDERYPNATEAELSALSDRTCIICREEMIGVGAPPSGPEQSRNEVRQDGPPATDASQGEQRQNNVPQNGEPPAVIPDGPNMVPKRLPCGHIFHFQCLRAWLERQQNCPTCRHSVFEAPQQPRTNTNQQPPNAPAGAQGQQVPPQGNAGGFFGRLVGAAGAPPIVPGQFAPGPGQAQFPQQPAPIQNGNPQQAPAQLPRHQLFVAQPERFQGFVLPDGNWLPWPREDDLANNGVRVQTEVPIEASEVAPLTSNESSFRHEANGRPSSPSSAEPDSQPSPGLEDASLNGSLSVPEARAQDTSSGAREAAGAAALRRFGSTNTRTGEMKTASKSRVQAPKAPISAHENTTSRPESSRTESQIHSNVSTSRPSQGSSVAPPFIPLYDPSATVPQTGSHRPASNTSSTPDLSISGRQRTGRNSSASRTPSAQAQAQSNLQNNFTSSRTQSQRFESQSLRELPQQLSVDQLTNLDQLTREAIDERLRLLENVETVATRCITELLRCRSLLPRSNPSTPQATHTASRPDERQDADFFQRNDSGSSISERPSGGQEASASSSPLHVETETSA